MHRSRDDGNAQHTPHRQHDKHRHKRLPGASANACYTVGIRQQAEEKRFHTRLPYADANGFRDFPPSAAQNHSALFSDGVYATDSLHKFSYDFFRLGESFV